MVQTEQAHDELLSSLESVANDSLSLWDIPDDARARLINISENATYLVENSTGYRSVLRIHREDYHTERAIECELLWMDALNAGNCVVTPETIPGKNGHVVQKAGISALPNQRYLVLFKFVQGIQPNESQDLAFPFEQLGEMAAKTHAHTIGWQRPDNFERLVWDLDAFYGPNATWGNWRDGPNITKSEQDILERVETVVTQRLSAFGQSEQRYGLIHADMRLANLLIDGETTRLIDFDDCGFGWFLYDFAAGISFIEDNPQIPTVRDAWVRGYRKFRDLSDEEEREIDSFVMLRRMALLAWIGSHINAPEAQALADHFARVSAELGESYLSRMT